MVYYRRHQQNIFEIAFQTILEPDHELILLSERINWEEVTDRLLPYYSMRGRPAKKIRLMVGLHILNHRFDLSDEQVVQGLHGNLYWMKFCGVSVSPSHSDDKEGKPKLAPPRFLNASSMTKFRNRIGAGGMRIVEDVIRENLISEKQICPGKQFSDTTAMQKDIAYPTDAGLLQKGREILLRTMGKIKQQGVRIPERLRSFARGKQGAGLQSRRRKRLSDRKIVHYP